MLVRRQWKANFEASRNALRARHGNEQRVKVGAVALFRVAGIEHVAASPAGAGLVVLQGGENVVVNGAGLVEWIALALRDLDGKVSGQTCNRDQSVRLQIVVPLRARQSRGR